MSLSNKLKNTFSYIDYHRIELNKAMQSEFNDLEKLRLQGLQDICFFAEMAEAENGKSTLKKKIT